MTDNERPTDEFVLYDLNIVVEEINGNCTCNMNKITLVTALHGNESIPVFALASQNIEQVVANPKALSVNKRFLQHDMNKSFATGGSTYEEVRAGEILNQIPENNVVLDLHTMSAVSDPFAIIVDKKMIEFASTLGLKHIVYMKHNIKKGHALINLRDGVSVEVGQHESFEAFENTLKIVKNANESVVDNNVQVYEVYDIITKPGNYQNFIDHSEGFVPVLAGEKAYEFYGLKAQKID